MGGCPRQAGRSTLACMGRSLAAVGLFVVLAAAVSAQQTWIVDPNGTGNFTDLGVAIATASSGDTLLLRGGGNYQGSYSVNKALAFIGDSQPRPRIYGLSFTAAPAGSQPAVLTSLEVDRLSFGRDASLEDVRVTYAVVSSAVASFHRCVIGGPSTLSGGLNLDGALNTYYSEVLLSECSITGCLGWFIQTLQCTVWAGRCVVAQGGRVTIVDSTLRGADSNSVWCSAGWTPPGPALSLDGTAARVTQSNLFGGLYPGIVRTAAVTNSGGTLEYDSSTWFMPPNSIGTVTFLPGTGGQGALPGGTMSCRAESGPGLPAALVASLGLRAPTMLPQGIAWIDPSAFVILRIGFTDASGFLAASIPIPVSVPRGLPITVQSVVAPGATGPLAAGVPVVLHVL